MSAKHTQGEVIPAVSSFQPIGPCYAVGIQDAKVAIAITGKFGEPDADISEANARRIAACWNACDGFSIEELEGADLFKDSIESGNLINELLAALKQCRLALEPYDDVKPRDWKTDREKLAFAHQAACAAIIKATSQQ